MNKKSNRIVEFPDCFDEIEPSEWMHFLAALDLMLHDRLFDLTDVRNHFAYYCLRRRSGVRHFGVPEFYTVHQLAGTLQWLITQDPLTGQVCVPIDTTAQLLPRCGKLYGPSGHAADLTFGEFRHAVMAMNAYTRTHSKIHLAALSAILYRPRDRQGRREPFRTEQVVEAMRHPNRKVVPCLQYGIYLWFAHLCEYIRTGTFIVGGHEVCFAPLFVSGGDTDAPATDLGLEGIRLSVAASGTFGTATQVDDTLLLDVLLKMLQDKQTIDQLKKRYSHADSIR